MSKGRGHGLVKYSPIGKGKGKPKDKGNHPGGRPPVVLKPEVVEGLYALGCTDAEVAGWFGVGVETIYQRKRDSKKFSESEKKGRAKGKISIRRGLKQSADGVPAEYLKDAEGKFVRENGELVQIQAERAPIVTAQIFLGKVMCGMVETEHRRVTQEMKDEHAVRVPDPSETEAGGDTKQQSIVFWRGISSDSLLPVADRMRAQHNLDVLLEHIPQKGLFDDDDAESNAEKIQHFLLEMREKTGGEPANKKTPKGAKT